jgi:hypothetical protein
MQIVSRVVAEPSAIIKKQYLPPNQPGQIYETCLKIKNGRHLAANPPQRVIIIGRQTGNVVDGGSDCGVKVCEEIVPTMDALILNATSPRGEAFFE